MLKLISATFQCACVLALFLATPILRAQFETATLTGAISDPQGALIPKASVKLTNEATNAEISVVTDEEAGTLSMRSGPALIDWLRPRQDSSSSYPAVSFFR